MTQCISFQEINISAFHRTQWEVMLLWNLNATRHHNQWHHCNYHPHTCQPPEYKKSGDVYKSLHCKNFIFYNVQKLSEIPLKAFRMFSTSITVCKNHTNFLPSIVQFDWLISNQLLYSLNIYQIDSSALRFPFEFSSNKSTKSTSCFIFLFDLSKIMKLMKKLWKRSRKTFPGRFGALTGRPGDLMKNLETPGKTGRVGRCVSKADSCFCLAMRTGTLISQLIQRSTT